MTKPIKEDKFILQFLKENPEIQEFYDQLSKTPGWAAKAPLLKLMDIRSEIEISEFRKTYQEGRMHEEPVKLQCPLCKSWVCGFGNKESEVLNGKKELRRRASDERGNDGLAQNN